MNEARYVHPDFARPLDQLHLDSVQGAFAFTGGEKLSKPGLGSRERIRLELPGPAAGPIVCYLKRYAQPLPRRWLCPAQTPAEVEMRNIHACRAAGVSTMQCLAMGQDSAGRSFIVVDSVPGQSLETCFGQFLRSAGVGSESMARFNQRLVELVGSLHKAGLVHRDLYASHIFLDQSGGSPALHLIDLARVFSPRWRLFRWRVKDLAGLLFSLPQEWSSRWWGEFLQGYLARLGLGAAGTWQRAIDAKVARMRRHQQRHQEAGQ